MCTSTYLKERYNFTKTCLISLLLHVSFDCEVLPTIAETLSTKFSKLSIPEEGMENKMDTGRGRLPYLFSLIIKSNLNCKFGENRKKVRLEFERTKVSVKPLLVKPHRWFISAFHDLTEWAVPIVQYHCSPIKK